MPINAGATSVFRLFNMNMNMAISNGTVFIIHIIYTLEMEKVCLRINRG